MYKTTTYSTDDQYNTFLKIISLYYRYKYLNTHNIYINVHSIHYFIFIGVQEFWFL